MKTQTKFFWLLILPLFLSTVISGCMPERLPKVVIQTGIGQIVVEVDTVKAPVTGSNFLQLASKGVYDGAVFYRVVRTDNQPGKKEKIEVIQGGLFADSLVLKYPTIPHETTRETGILHLDGTISMARNEPGTASTEFFICIGDQPSLDFGGLRNPDGQGFAAFGKVVEGMDIVRKIQQGEDESQYLKNQVKIIQMVIQNEKGMP